VWKRPHSEPDLHGSLLRNLGRFISARWSVAVEATGWELMLQFARVGLGIAVVNDFCTVPRGLSSCLVATRDARPRSETLWPR
jgi:DNA-binding transcriptional LysR family regulator